MKVSSEVPYRLSFKKSFSMYFLNEMCFQAKRNSSSKKRGLHLCCGTKWCFQHFEQFCSLKETLSLFSVVCNLATNHTTLSSSVCAITKRNNIYWELGVNPQTGRARTLLKSFPLDRWTASGAFGCSGCLGMISSFHLQVKDFEKNWVVALLFLHIL